MADRQRSSGPVLGLIAFLIVALCVYFFLLGRTGVELMTQGTAVSIGLGIGVFVLPLLGVWMVVATLRSGLEHQRMAAAARDAGRDLDVADLPRRPSGRIEHDAAQALFAEVKVEWEKDPSDWISTYRIARAYDYAGDRTRAREMMKRAAEQYRVAVCGP
ncbi:tetratricopeptide repeat protein [Gordonia shandongensis]|uniref:tetratricopeptide repeat protein n=1 Tax=Gordonia shandongensis TaxID=376351 RepID=UPI0003F5EE90|nr:tetratricopeptide repeat protein [Gordonia shandongensis]